MDKIWYRNLSKSEVIGVSERTLIQEIFSSPSCYLHFQEVLFPQVFQNSAWMYDLFRVFEFRDVLSGVQKEGRDSCLLVQILQLIDTVLKMVVYIGKFVRGHAY